MTGFSFRMIVAPFCGAAMCLLVMPRVDAARNSPIIDQFVGRAVDASGTQPAGRIDIYIDRWSTDAELEQLGGTLLRRDDPWRLLSALAAQLRPTGVVLMPGIQAHGARSRGRIPKTLLFARDIETPEGRRVIVASDEHMGIGEKPLDAYKEISEFNLIEIRFGVDGTGLGKLVTAADVTYNAATSILEVTNYAARPAQLIEVRSERR